jgi:dTDP-4-amino-4,6-dideoxygalactose transaminase
VNRIEFVDLKRQYASIKEEVDRAVIDTIASADYILGDEVGRFEEEWAAYCGVRHCVGVASGTAALDLAYSAIGVGPETEVIAPANTFIATVQPALRLGAGVVLVDCDDLGQIDVEALARALTPRTTVIAGVDLFGHPCDADAIDALCREHGIAFVEDAAQAHGAEYKGRRCGSLGRVAAFSFYPGKNLGAYGDAGAVVTNDGELAARVRMLRNLGQREKYEHVLVAGNERLDTVQAAVLRVKLRRLDRWNELRRHHAATYNELIADAVRTPEVADGALPVWHLYVIRTEGRDELRAALAEERVATGMHYPLPLHLQPALSGLGYSKGDFPNAEEWARTSFSLPMFPELQLDEIRHIAGVINRVAAASV